MAKEQIKQQIAKLVAKYEEAVKEGKIKSYNEEMTKKDFILPLFKILGWDTEGREVSAEVHTQSSGRVDYAFLINGFPKFYLEAKALKEDLNREDFARQAIRYSWNKGVTWAVLTDFESVKIFNAQTASKYLGDKLFKEIKWTEYLARLDELWLLSKEALEQGLLDQEAEKSGKKLQKLTVSEKLYEDLNLCREELTKELKKWNDVNDDDLDEGIQRILDRLVFIRVAEDRGLEPERSLLAMVHEYQASKKMGKVPLFKTMIERFRELDEIYDSNLFTKHPCEDWGEFSGVTEKVIKRLYGVEGYYDYDFKHIPADVLGSVYENYLGYRLSKSKKGVTLDKDAKKRKEQGIYYTPTFIVDYIVKNALKPVLDKCQSVNDLKKIRVLDPACGSGSFLVKALEVINEKYKEFNYKGDTYTKLDILLNNIYGVDLDKQAVEIARLNLLINALDKKMKLPSLADNIKNGNSLISGEEKELKEYFGKDWREKKPFNWEEEFPGVFKQGGFDAVIGNPPWGADITADYQFLAKHYPDSTKEKKDTYKTFIDKAIQLLKIDGVLGFITPNSFLYQPSYEDIKELIEHYSYRVVNLGEKIFSGVELPCSMLILEKNGSKNTRVIVDLTQEERGVLPKILSAINFDEYRRTEEAKTKIIKKTSLTFDDVFELKDAGIQYHRSGIGLSNKGGSDLYERIFCNKSENKFKNAKETWYGKLIARYYVTDETDEIFNLDYKSLLNKNESVSFTRDAFEEKEKILWRQTAASLVATMDTKKRWFRNTIQCGYLKDKYKNSVNLFYALSIFNSKYIDYVYRRMVLETGRVFPQVKIRYLKQLPFIVPKKNKQQYLASLADKMIDLNKQLQSLPENSDKWNSIKSEIEKTDKLIDQKVYELYGLGEEEIKVVEGR